MSYAECGTFRLKPIFASLLDWYIVKVFEIATDIFHHKPETWVNSF